MRESNRNTLMLICAIGSRLYEEEPYSFSNIFAIALLLVIFKIFFHNRSEETPSSNLHQTHLLKKPLTETSNPNILLQDTATAEAKRPVENKNQRQPQFVHNNHPVESKERKNSGLPRQPQERKARAAHNPLEALFGQLDITQLVGAGAGAGAGASETKEALRDQMQRNIAVMREHHEMQRRQLDNPQFIENISRMQQQLRRSLGLPEEKKEANHHEHLRAELLQVHSQMQQQLAQAQNDPHFVDHITNIQQQVFVALQRGEPINLEGIFRREADMSQLRNEIRKHNAVESQAKNFHELQNTFEEKRKKYGFSVPAMYSCGITNNLMRRPMYHPKAPRYHYDQDALLEFAKSSYESENHVVPNLGQIKHPHHRTYDEKHQTIPVLLKEFRHNEYLQQMIHMFLVLGEQHSNRLLITKDDEITLNEDLVRSSQTCNLVPVKPTQGKRLLAEDQLTLEAIRESVFNNLRMGLAFALFWSTNAPQQHRREVIKYLGKRFLVDIRPTPRDDYLESSNFGCHP